MVDNTNRHWKLIDLVATIVALAIIGSVIDDSSLPCHGRGGDNNSIVSGGVGIFATAFQVGIDDFRPTTAKRPRCFRSATTTTATGGSSSFLFSSSTNTQQLLTTNYDGHINIEESAYRDFESFENWAVTYGIQRAPVFQLYSTNEECDSGDVSVMTNGDVPANTPVLFVPNELILSSRQVMAEFGPMEQAERIIDSLNSPNIKLGHYYLMMKILVEYEKGEQSPWYPWLSSLPRYYSNGASMTPFCYKCLPPLASELARKERQHLMYLSNCRHVPFLSEATKQNQELRKWAFQIVFTRSFENPHDSDDIKIVPMADMFNHQSFDPELTIQYDDKGNCYATTIRDIPAGSPLRICYTNDSANPSYIFARYGFVDESSPASFCKYMIRGAEKNPQLINIGYSFDKMLFYKDTGDVSQEVWDVLLYEILGASNIELQQQFYNAHVSGDYKTKSAVHQQYYAETLGELRHHVETFLYDLEQLSSNSIGVDITEHPRLPLIVRHNEFVKQAFLAVQNRYFCSSSF